jgi:glycosyl transferase family 25
VTVPVFVINLERDTARRRRMEALLAAAGLEAEFVTAVDGRALSDAERARRDRARSLRVYGVELFDTELACCLSHLQVYERIVRDGIAAALVMEDDIALDSDFADIVRDLAARDIPDWLVIRLTSLRQRVAEPRSAKFRGTPVAALPRGRALYRLKTHVLGGGAYLIRRDGAARMLDYAGRPFMAIDQMMDRYWENGILPFVVRPFPATQHTDIPSSTEERPRGRHRQQPFAIRMGRRLQRVRDGAGKRLFNLTH